MKSKLLVSVLITLTILLLSSFFQNGKHHYIQRENTKGIPMYTTYSARLLEVAKLKPKPTSIQLEVPLISQLPLLPTGCEVVSLTMLLNYKGLALDPNLLANQMPYADSSDLGFTGSPYLPSGGSIDPIPLGSLLEFYLGSYSLPIDIEKELIEGKPVLVWLPLLGFTTHTVVLTGYNSEVFFYNDPYTFKKESVSKEEFYYLWGLPGNKALTI